MKNTIENKNLHIVAFNWETEENQVILTSPQWAMTEKVDGYLLEDEKTQTKNVNHYLSSVANSSHETIFELVFFEIK
jgi:hypothetical protein